MAQRVYHPRKDYNIPTLDLLTCLFDHPDSWAKEDKICHAEASNPSNCITKAQVRTYTKRIAHGLRHQYGIGADGPGKDVVVVISSGQIMLPTVFYATICAGGVYSAASASSTAAELARQVRQGESNLIICSADAKEVAFTAAKDCGVPLERVMVLESSPRVLNSIGSGRSCIADQELDWMRITDKDELENSVICLLYSSGTTGVPKGVNLSHANIVSEGLITQYLMREYFARQAAKDHSYTPFDYRTLAHLPAAHIAGCQGYFVNPTIAGGTVYWMPKFDFPKFLEYNQKCGITSFFTVPPIYLLIAKSSAVTDQFRTLVHAITGAAPMGAELTALAEKKLGARISQTWGLSETTGSVTLMPWDEHDVTGSVSPLMPNARMRVLDEEEKDVEEGKPGEFCMKGPMVSKGYFKNAEGTRDAFTSDGWFKTGDIGEVREGRFYIVDRKKELIKYKGLQVAPAELEALLLTHDLITDAAVIGVDAPDGSGNELPRAYVVADRLRISEQEIKDYVKKNVAQYKQLRGGVVWLEAIPKSPSGKILRRELRVMAKQEKESKLQAKL